MVTIHDTALLYDVSEAHLKKVVQLLARKGYLRAVRGHGGGYAHALVLLRWAMQPLPGARLTLIDPNPVAPYTGMLPGLIAVSDHDSAAARRRALAALPRP